MQDIPWQASPLERRRFRKTVPEHLMQPQPPPSGAGVCTHQPLGVWPCCVKGLSTKRKHHLKEHAVLSALEIPQQTLPPLREMFHNISRQHITNGLTAFLF